MLAFEQRESKGRGKEEEPEEGDDEPASVRMTPVLRTLSALGTSFRSKSDGCHSRREV